MFVIKYKCGVNEIRKAKRHATEISLLEPTWLLVKFLLTSSKVTSLNREILTKFRQNLSNQAVRNCTLISTKVFQLHGKIFTSERVCFCTSVFTIQGDKPTKVTTEGFRILSTLYRIRIKLML